MSRVQRSQLGQSKQLPCLIRFQSSTCHVKDHFRLLSREGQMFHWSQWVSLEPLSPQQSLPPRYRLIHGTFRTPGNLIFSAPPVGTEGKAQEASLFHVSKDSSLYNGLLPYSANIWYQRMVVLIPIAQIPCLQTFLGLGFSWQLSYVP